MERLKSRVAEWLADLALAAVPLTPVLSVLNALSPIRLPWVFVFLPWIVSFHLLLCWVSGQMIAHMLSAVVDAVNHR